MAAPIHDCIYLFGDSITQVSFEPGGFGQLLAGRSKISLYPFSLTFFTLLLAKYARQLDVLNRGYAGYNTNCMMPLLKQVSSQLIYIECIANHTWSISYVVHSEERRPEIRPKDSFDDHMVRRE